MKVLFDSQIFSLQDYGGISRYYAEIMARLPKYDILPVSDLTLSHNQYLKDLSYGITDSWIYRNKYHNYIYRILNTALGIIKLNFIDYDLYHPTYYEKIFLPLTHKKPLIITVYDMIHELFSKEYPSLKNKIIKNKKYILSKADHIIAISNSTKSDIQKIYGIDGNSISVIPLANSLLPWDKQVKLRLPEKYLLYVGFRWIYKNFMGFVKAVSDILIKNNLYLVSAGGNIFNSDEIDMFSKLGISDRVIYQSITNDRDLSECYSRALAFVYPSRYEGFGIPILEAFENKCPVVISHNSSFPEIAGDAAIYFRPENETSIRNSIQKVIENSKLRKDLVSKGNIRIKKYSWDKTAYQTSIVYRDVLRNYNKS